MKKEQQKYDQANLFPIVLGPIVAEQSPEISEPNILEPAAIVGPQILVPETENFGRGIGRENCFGCKAYDIKVRVTHYYPPEGGTNCWRFINGYCVSNTASGIPWENVMDLAVACPYDFPLGSWVEIREMGSYICLDRGEMVCVNGICEMDILSANIGHFDGGTYDAKVWVNWDAINE